MKAAEVSGAASIVYGRAEKISEYGIASVINEQMISSAADARLEIQVLAPVDAEKNHLYAVRSAAVKCCKAQGIVCSPIRIVRTAAVAYTSVLVSGFGLREDSGHKETMREGQDLVLTKYIGMEGTLRILDEKMEELSKRFSNVFLDQIREKRSEIFAKEEILTARAAGASAMRQVGDGGIFAALYRLAEEAKRGLTVDLKQIPIRQETIEICEYYRLNPYQLTSTGNILIVCDDGEALVQALQNKNIEAAVIGKLTGDNDKVIKNGEDVRYIDRPAPDELIKIY